MKQLHAGTQYLSFFIGAEQYGLGILESREVLQYPTVTVVPSMSRSIRGVINLRGTAVPVVDLAVVFGHATQQITKRTCIVIVESDPRLGDGSLIGLVVESIHQVFELRAEEIEPSPDLGTRGRAKFIRGLGRATNGFVLLLDLPRVLEHVDLDESLNDIPLPDAITTTSEVASADAEATSAENDAASTRAVDDAATAARPEPEQQHVFIDYDDSDESPPEAKEPTQP